jgi:hypothetical protein
MPQSNLKTVATQEKIHSEQIELICEGLAITLSQEDVDLAGLFLLASEMGRHCHDWNFIDSTCNTIMRELLIYTRHFDDAERRFDAECRAMLSVAPEKGGTP